MFTSYHGCSRKVLPNILSKLNETPVTFWLDAHCSFGHTAGIDDQCPLLDELNIILKRNQDDIILIDDARLFMKVPPPPHNIDQWPTLTEIFDCILKSKKKRYVQIINDVIFILPNKKQYKKIIHNNQYLIDLENSNKTTLIKKIKSSLECLFNQYEKYSMHGKVKINFLNIFDEEKKELYTLYEQPN